MTHTCSPTIFTDARIGFNRDEYHEGGDQVLPFSISVTGFPRELLLCKNPSAWVSSAVGSLRFGSIRLVAYSDDHFPRHVHAFYEGAEVIVDLREDKSAAIADRPNAYWPRDLKRSTLKKVLTAAAKNFDELVNLWEKVHGSEESEDSN